MSLISIIERRFFWVLCGFTLLALLIRLYNIGAQSFWYDEAMTFIFSEAGPAALLTEPLDTHPPLFYLIEWLVIQFSHSEAAMRFPAAVFGAASVFAIALLGRQLTGSAMAGLLSAFMFALSDLQLYYAQEARNYTLVTALMLFATCALVRLLDRAHQDEPQGSLPDLRSKSFWQGVVVELRSPAALAYLILAVLALYTHVLAGIYLLALNLVLAGRLLSRQGVYWTRLGSWGLVNLLAVVAWSPWVSVIFSATDRVAWITQPGLKEAAQVYINTFGSWELPIWVDGLLGLGTLAGFFLLMRSRRWSGAGVIAACFFLYPALVYAAGFVIKPIFDMRVLQPAEVAMCLGLGALVTATPSRSLAFVAAGVSVAASFWCMAGYFARPIEPGWRTLVADIESEIGPNDAVVSCFRWTAAEAYYYRLSASNNFTLHAYASGENYVVSETDLKKFADSYRLPTQAWAERDEGDWLAYYEGQHAGVKRPEDLHDMFDTIYFTEQWCAPAIEDDFKSKLAKLGRQIDYSELGNRWSGPIGISRIRKVEQ